MNLPFTTDEFVSVFRDYNLSVWPAQIILNLLGIAAVILIIRHFGHADTIVGIILGFLWLWIGIVYHLVFFKGINPAAYFFGAANIAEGLLFLGSTISKSRLSFSAGTDLHGIIGWFFVLYAMVLYPFIGYTLGHVYPSAPTFGLPCPTTIFTFGILMWSTTRVPVGLLVIPFLWSLLGFSAAVSLGMLEDTGLLVAGVLGTALIIIRHRKPLPALSRSVN